MKKAIAAAIGIFVVALLVCLVYILLSPPKDYKQLALGKWVNTKNKVYADVTGDSIRFTMGTRKLNVFYDLHVDQDPMVIDVWEGKDKYKVYSGIIVFDNDDKVKAIRLPEASGKDDYFTDLSEKMTIVWDRVKEDKK